MERFLDPFRFLLVAAAGWMNGRQLQLIDYLREENRVLREQLSGKRLRFTDYQRRRLTTKAKELGADSDEENQSFRTDDDHLVAEKRCRKHCVAGDRHRSRRNGETGQHYFVSAVFVAVARAKFA